MRSDFVEAVADPELRGQLVAARDRMAMAPEAVVRAVAFAIEQPQDVGEIVVRPTAQA